MKGISIILLTLAALGARAQEIELREIQVSASRPITDTGIEKTTLDTTTLHQNLALSMADILQGNSTLFIKSYGRATESTAEFRGTSPSHTQVTWNGMKINSPMLGTVDFSYIPGYFVDEATLLHGASSITTTGGGLGGSIELSTRPQFHPAGFSAQFTQGAGSYRTFDDFLHLSYGTERWFSNTRLSYGHSKNDFTYTNHDKKVDKYDAQNNLVDSYHPRERNRSGYFDDINLMQELGFRDQHGNQLGASVWWAWSKRGLPFLSVDYKDDTDFRNEHLQQTTRSLIYWRHRHQRWTSDLRAGYTYQDIAYDYSTTRNQNVTNITHSRSYCQTGYLQANLNFYPTDHWMLTANAATYYNKVRSWDRSPFHNGNNYSQGRMEESLSLSAKWRPADILSLNAVARGEVYGDRFVPVIPALLADVVLYKPWNLVLKASIARNYRYPSMDDLYFQPGGNPNLHPEKGFTYDGGLELGIQRKRWTLQANLTAFDSHITDWILWTPNSKGYWVPSNVKKVHNYGLEAMAQSEILLHKDWKLSLSGNFAYTPSINRGEPYNASDASYGKQLCYVPRVSCNLNGRLQWRTWTLAYQWVHYGERYTTTSNEVNYITGKLRPYYMSDAWLEKQFHLRHHTSLSLKAVVNNVFDTEYVTVLSHPMAGRNYEFFVEIKY